MSQKNTPVALLILDGFGISDQTSNNAIAKQGIPNIKELFANYPHTTIKTSGLDVGLPAGQMGNSEVGHLNIGAGRIVYQDITAIDKSIFEREFFDNKAFLGAIENCKKNKTALHFVGLLSDGGVHSTIEHLYALLELAKQHGLKEVYVHALADGRDVPPKSVQKYTTALQHRMTELGVGKIATIIGRYYLMDRDNRWERVKVGYDAMFDGIGPRFSSVYDAVTTSYAEDISSDEFIKGCVFGDYTGVKKDDSIIFFNFRSDRAREISRVALDKDFVEFKREKPFRPVYYVGFTRYDTKLEELGIHTAFPPRKLVNTLGEYLAKNGLKQARVAETEKYAHVTFFFNGGVEEANENESRILVPSPKVATYDLQPEMSALEVTQKAKQSIDDGIDVMILNYANCDMVGHTAVEDAAIKAVEVVDKCVFELTNHILKAGGTVLITADHGNIEQLTYEDGSPCTSHTTNVVPLLVVGDKYKGAKLTEGKLCDIAPTMLDILGLQKPKEMTGNSLICQKQ